MSARTWNFGAPPKRGGRPAPAWTVTFADLCSLLVTIFVFLAAQAAPASTARPQPATPEPAKPSTPPLPAPAEPTILDLVREGLEGDASAAEVLANPGGDSITIRIRPSLAFARGTDALSERVGRISQRLGERLASSRVTLCVAASASEDEGEPEAPSLRLAARRAVHLLERIASAGFPPERLNAEASLRDPAERILEIRLAEEGSP